MAWSQSGLYAAVLAEILKGTAGYPDWDANTNKFFLTSNSDTPDYNQAAASAVYSVTNEVSGTGWAAGGIAASALAAGSADIVLNLTTVPTPATIQYKAGNVSVAGTTLTGAYGGYFYKAAATSYKIAGIYFGGSGYSTVAGTFAITWSGGIIATIQCAAT